MAELVANTNYMRAAAGDMERYADQLVQIGSSVAAVRRGLGGLLGYPSITGQLSAASTNITRCAAGMRSAKSALVNAAAAYERTEAQVARRPRGATAGRPGRGHAGQGYNGGTASGGWGGNILKLLGAVGPAGQAFAGIVGLTSDEDGFKKAKGLVDAAGSIAGKVTNPEATWKDALGLNPYKADKYSNNFFADYKIGEDATRAEKFSAGAKWAGAALSFGSNVNKYAKRDGGIGVASVVDGALATAGDIVLSTTLKIGVGALATAVVGAGAVPAVAVAAVATGLKLAGDWAVRKLTNGKSKGMVDWAVNTFKIGEKVSKGVSKAVSAVADTGKAIGSAAKKTTKAVANWAKSWFS